MLDSYLFVPADRNDFIVKIETLNADYIVFDLEDSVSISNKQKAVTNMLNIDFKSNYYLRVPLEDGIISTEKINELVLKFNGQIVLPKIEKVEEFELFLAKTKFNFIDSIILLIESPLAIINLTRIIQSYGHYIKAVGFGSHDFCAEMGMKHNFEQLNIYRKEIVLIAKAFKKQYIDSVDVSINEIEPFIEECVYAFESGADGKFLIHPNQLKSLNSIEFLSKSEIEDLYKVFSKIENKDIDQFDILVVDGVIYEKPHMKKIQNTIFKLNKKQDESK